MKTQCAKESDYEKIRDFYYELTDAMNDAEFKPGWKKDVYPSQEDLRTAIRNKEFYFMRNDSELYAAMIINHQYNEGYRNVSWSVNVPDEKLLVIHALGVLPEYSGKGVAKELVNEAIHIAKKQNVKTIRLDVLEGNLPAEHAYTKMGFEYVTTLSMFYEDTGWTNYRVYEYLV